jgi:DNA-binding MarR family transcriptional regulator
MHRSDSDQPSLTTHYAQRLAEGVDLPSWAAGSFSPAELAVLGAIRDAAYKSADNTCLLRIEEIARLVEVHPRIVVRAITVAIAAGLIERDGSNLVNRGIHYKVG